MNRFRVRMDHKKVRASATHEDDSGSHDAELSDVAESLSDVASAHRAGVIAKDKAAKARRRKGGRRG